MGQSGPLTSILGYQKRTNHGSWKVLEGRRLCCRNRCGLYMVLFLATWTFAFLCITGHSLLSTQWGQVGPSPPPVSSCTTGVHTEVHSGVHIESHVEVRTKAHTEVRTKAHTEVRTKARIEVRTKARIEVRTKAQIEVRTKAHTEVRTKAQIEVHTKAHVEVHTEAHVEVHSEVHTKFQWETPGPYHVAYPRDYIFVLDEPDACSAENPFLLLIVPVAAKNRVARDAIRRTWGNESLVLGKTVRLFFLLGLPGGKGSERLQADVARERAESHDLLQGDFLDSYHNLTIKTMMMLEWVASRCPNASYAMKIDSDMFLNVRNLVKMLLDPKTPKRSYITGLVARNRPPLRDKDSKWYLPVDVYPHSTYPPYLLGMGYVFSNDLPKKLVDVSKQIKPLYIEDVHLGICLKKLGVKPTEPPSYTLFQVHMPVPYNRCHYASVITTILDGPARLLQCWGDLHKPNPPC